VPVKHEPQQHNCCLINALRTQNSQLLRP